MLATASEADAETVAGLTAAARRLGHEVSLFLTGEGVRLAARFVKLQAPGTSLVGCAYSTRALGLPRAEGVTWGSQLDWAMAANAADRVVVLA